MRNVQLLFVVLFIALRTAAQGSAHFSVIAIVLACQRSSHLKKTLRSLASSSAYASPLPVYVSVDEHPKSYRAVRAANREPNVRQVWQHVSAADYPAETTRERIARHYHFALSRAFDSPDHANVSHVIVLEDDLFFSPDFAEYMLAAAKHVTTADENSIVCASGWNDNGRHHGDIGTAHLTSFFPGLGWVLPRALWTQYLRPNWPGAPTTNAKSIVGIGWDFWLRVAFDTHRWTCLTPAVPRVFHFGATGANVAEQETERYFSSSPLADVPPGTVDWETVLAKVADKQSTVHAVQKRLTAGRLVKSLDEARKHSTSSPVMPYLRETYKSAIAEPLKLWPTPRGHFHHTVLVQLGNGKDLLLYDARRAAEHFKLPKLDLGSEPFRLQRADRNVSCEKACETLGLQCTTSSLEYANSCERLSQVMPDRCQVGCAYETGKDLPARVDDAAPLQTAGMCLIAETGSAEDGQLDCKGSHEWTRRSCACVQKAESTNTRDEL